MGNRVIGAVLSALYKILMSPNASKLFLGRDFLSFLIRCNQCGLEDFDEYNVSMKVAPKAATNVIFGPVSVP